jgi:hypothetical protein
VRQSSRILQGKPGDEEESRELQDDRRYQTNRKGHVKGRRRHEVEDVDEVDDDEDEDGFQCSPVVKRIKRA